MTCKEAGMELARAKAALSALSGLPDAATVAEHADAIEARLGWAAKVIRRLEPSGDAPQAQDEG